MFHHASTYFAPKAVQAELGQSSESRVLLDVVGIEVHALPLFETPDEFRFLLISIHLKTATHKNTTLSQ